MKCVKCKHENPEALKICQECGAPLIAVTEILDTQAESKSDPLDFAPGEKFGSRYQIIEEIGKGGMGKVFKARDLELGIVVALKMIKPELSSDPSIVSRFKRELLLAREIVHENVIRIHDLGEIDQIRYISMNFIQGNSLKEIIQSTGKLTVEKSIDIAKQVCGALKAAHDKDIVHRDLKPQNIMIDKKGNAFVLDFGIARSVVSTSETEAGMVLGTPDFISPEQIQGQSADTRSDIYSLGIIMYEMVTGQLPFKADERTALLYKHLHEAPTPPSKLNPQMPKKLEKIILKCLEKKKKNRFQSMGQILEELEQGRTGQIRTLKEKEKEKLSTLAAEAPAKKKSRIGKKLLKLAFGIFLLLLVVYAVISGLSLFNDFRYAGKLDNIKVEDEYYYKDLFPIRKDWLPGDRQHQECNAWDTYTRLFPPLSDEKGNPIPLDQYLENDAHARTILLNPDIIKSNKVFKNLDYENIEDLEDVLENWGKHFKFDELAAALECNTIDSYALLKANRPLYAPLVEKYADMFMLRARVDFLAGNQAAGLSKIYQAMLFSLDLLSGSTSLKEDRAAVDCFQNACRELIVYLLSRETTFNIEIPIPAGEQESEEKNQQQPEQPQEEKQTEQQDQPAQQPTQPVDQEQPAEQEETGEPQGDPEQRYLALIKDLIAPALQKLQPESILKREYLALARHHDDVFASFNIEKTAYYAYKKIEFWPYWFSINRRFFKQGVGFYQGLLDGMKFSSSPLDKSRFINDYFEKHADSSGIIAADIPHLAFKLNTARNFGKLVLILLNLGEYGPDSREFADLKGSDIFINEFSGKRFALQQDATGFSIQLTREYRLPLTRIDYAAEHRELLKSFKCFDSQSAEQIKALFSSESE